MLFVERVKDLNNTMQRIRTNESKSHDSTIIVLLISPFVLGAFYSTIAVLTNTFNEGIVFLHVYTFMTGVLLFYSVFDCVKNKNGFYSSVYIVLWSLLYLEMAIIVLISWCAEILMKAMHCDTTIKYPNQVLIATIVSFGIGILIMFACRSVIPNGVESQPTIFLVLSSLTVGSMMVFKRFLSLLIGLAVPENDKRIIITDKIDREMRTPLALVFLLLLIICYLHEDCDIFYSSLAKTLTVATLIIAIEDRNA